MDSRVLLSEESRLSYAQVRRLGMFVFGLIVGIIIGLAAGSYIQFREKWPWKAASAATPKA
jgi:F0F1-type ATP synthase assembly protein I